MMQINLLPWRERRRDAIKRTFIRQILLAVTIAAIAVYASSEFLARQLAQQELINRVLEQQIVDLDARVTEVGSLREQQAAVRGRMRLIADLQKDRATVVRVLGQFVKSLPNEVYFLSLERADGVILIEGVSDSYAGVTELMRRLESSEEFRYADLNDIAAQVSEAAEGPSQFVFNLSVEIAKAMEGNVIATSIEEGERDG
jgi:type IV pilus assembly protein PilN